jgi:ADP-heptose:LPS heptosyltransferase
VTKFLIIRFSSIGDIVLTTPVVRCIKQQYPQAEVHFVTKKGYQNLVEHNPYIDKYFLLEKDLSPLLKQLNAEQYDYVIDLHHNLRTHIIKASLRWSALLSGKKIGITSFDKLNFEKWILVRFKKNILPQCHIVDRYLETVTHLGIYNDNKGLDYYIPHADEVETSWLPSSHQQGFVVYSIGGQHETKKLPIKQMITLCNRIAMPLVLLGGKEDAANAEQICQALPNQLIFNGCGKFNLNQSASLIRNSMLVYTHDTGLMHIAAAFKKTIVSIWGNTVPQFGMYPYQTNYTVWEVKDLPCRPCSKIGFGKCPTGHFRCMTEQKLEV